MSDDKPKFKPIPKQAPQPKPEDENVKGAGDDQRRRLRAMAGRSNTVKTKRNAGNLKTTFG